MGFISGVVGDTGVSSRSEKLKQSLVGSAQASIVMSIVGIGGAVVLISQIGKRMGRAGTGSMLSAATE